MEFIIYFLLWFLCVSIGALPLGTVNVAVINTTLKDSAKAAKRIIIPASLAEVLLTCIAIYYFILINEFYTQYSGLQLVIALVLIVFGLVLIFGKKNCIRDEYGKCIINLRNFVLPKSVLGFVLGFFNPTVLLYWLFVISFFYDNFYPIHSLVMNGLMVVFLTGVLGGKIMVLWMYSIFSERIKLKIKGITNTINKVIGGLLLFLAVVQLLNYYL